MQIPSIAKRIEERARRGARPLALGRQAGLGACCPGRVTVNANYHKTGRPMGLGRRGMLGQTAGGGTRANTHTDMNQVGCTTYPDPAVPSNDCPGGWNGCGDTVAIPPTAVAAGAQVTIQIQAAIVFTPRFFLYTGPAGDFTIDDVRVANGPSATFGGGYSADIYAPGSFTSKAVSWPTFFNAPPLLLVVTNVDAMQQNFEGVLQGVAAHV